MTAVAFSRESDACLTRMGVEQTQDDLFARRGQLDAIVGAGFVDIGPSMCRGSF